MNPWLQRSILFYRLNRRISWNLYINEICPTKVESHYLGPLSEEYWLIIREGVSRFNQTIFRRIISWESKVFLAYEIFHYQGNDLFHHANDYSSVIFFFLAKNNLPNLSVIYSKSFQIWLFTCQLLLFTSQV
jgi:hypothetical protein